jgi:choline dehydrogenase
VPRATGHRVIFEGERAVGVEFARGGATEHVTAGRVILLADAIGSPHIRQLSTAYPATLWCRRCRAFVRNRRSGVHELKGVGRNMRDHFPARISYPVAGLSTANETARGILLAIEVLRWMFTGKGMLTYSPSQIAASVKVLESAATSDMQIGELEETPGVSAGAWQMRPLSRGYVTAQSNRPEESALPAGRDRPHGTAGWSAFRQAHVRGTGA